MAQAPVTCCELRLLVPSPYDSSALDDLRRSICRLASPLFPLCFCNVISALTSPHPQRLDPQDAERAYWALLAS